MDPLYHSGSSYESWFNKANELKAQAALLSFPEAHGIDRYSFLADIREEIEKGESIYRHATRVGEHEKKMVGSLVNDLKMILANETTKREAQKERDSPFSVLLYGGSSIGKSTLTKMLFYQYGKVFNLPTGSEFKYTRNAIDPFWSGFNSSQWCIQLDDIAFMRVEKAMAGDPSVMEMLQVNNNVPFVPNQAELADKGRTPVRAKLLIGTTNCEHLNAFHYFQTPLAVQRRFQFVIDVQVKDEYCKDHCMLDASLTDIAPGQWPNYWDFHVKRVVPVGDKRERQQGELELVKSFGRVNEFLAWFSSEAIQHSKVQKLVNNCDTNMEAIKICSTCFYPELDCECDMEAFLQRKMCEICSRIDCQCSKIQSIEMRLPSPLICYMCYKHDEACECYDIQTQEIVDPQKYFWYDLIRLFLLKAVLWFLSYSCLSGLGRFFLRRSCVQTALESSFVAPEYRMRLLRARFFTLGEQVGNKIGVSNLLVKTAAIVCALYASVKLYRTFFGPVAKDIQSNQKVDSSTIGSRPVCKEVGKVNPWFKDDFELTTFDIGRKTVSTAAMTLEQFAENIQKNMVFLESTYINDNGISGSRCIRALGLKGHLYLCNSHGLPLNNSFTLRVTKQLISSGITENLVCNVKQSDIVRDITHDIAIIRIKNFPCVKDITEYIPVTKIPIPYRGLYASRNEDGSIYHNAITYTKRLENITYKDEKHNICSDMWESNTTVPNVVNDCGTTLLVQTPRGIIIAGMHVLGNPNRPVSRAIAFEMPTINLMCSKLEDISISSGTPVLEAPGYEHKLVDLHYKSPVRWIEEGAAAVYGSFEGWRSDMRSRVGPTIIQSTVQEYGYEVQHGKPIMHGWEPWHIAVKDMVKPVTKLDNTILDNCVENFTKDILTSLPKSELDELMVYDDLTALNGVPGMTFVDKINRNTSAGAPFNKSKKFFLAPHVANGYTDCMMPTPIIMDRVNNIISAYKEGSRAMPVFTGCLKDEATKFSKIKMKKTRVFTGAPFDWSIVVRKYYLATIRLMQNNRFIFEAGPGTNAHSLEWQRIRNYLTQHGEDQMIAGDYASFDKSMPPCVILGAFQILINICRKAGYSQEDLAIMQGIAEDTAFPLIDMHGTLIQFYGSNPSGHPLTVIINSLANSLYMRYAYSVLSGGDCSNFQKHVSLFTYGDDNAMGVSKDAPFFNHTTIQKTLADVGIKYTMADKEAESIPYIHIDQISFLKRTWRWDEDVQAFLCPLEEESIAKSLLVGVVSKSISQEAQAIAIMSSANMEYFMFGKKIFHEKHLMFKDIIRKHDLEMYVGESDFPTWQQLYDRFWKSSTEVIPNLNKF
jgi:hypothetical protein